MAIWNKELNGISASVFILVCFNVVVCFYRSGLGLFSIWAMLTEVLRQNR
jgi:hypothetical protein